MWILGHHVGAGMGNGFTLYLDQHGGKLGGRTAEVISADEGEGPQTGVPTARAHALLGVG
jgi:branched-chain amino acid transport system substrate-binding protein